MSRNAVENWEFIVYKSVRGNDSSLVDIADVIDDHSVLCDVFQRPHEYSTEHRNTLLRGLEVMKFYLKQQNWNWRDPKMPKARAAGMLNSNT
jgi:hypothetical protein